MIDKHWAVAQVLESYLLQSEDFETLKKYQSLSLRHEPKVKVASGVEVMASTVGSASLVTLAFRALRKNSLLAYLGCGAAAIGMGIFSIDQWRRWREQEDLKLLLAALKSYENIQKKNLEYLTYLSKYQREQSPKDQLLNTICVISIGTVQSIISSFVDRLSGVSDLIVVLREFDVTYGGSLDPDIVLERFKQLYSLYLTIQSQFLLGLAIGLAKEELQIGDVKVLTENLREEVNREDFQNP